MLVPVMVALVVALVALVYAWAAQRQTTDLRRRLERLSGQLYDLNLHVDELKGQLEETTKELRFTIRQATGQLNYGPETTIGEIQATHPYADAILASFHMGGCHSCAVSPEETLAAACARLNVNQAALLAALHNGKPVAMTAAPRAPIALELE
jgi:hypothetical protein